MKKQAKNSIIYAIGTLLIAAVSFVSTMVLTRVLPEQTYAQYGLLTTFVTASVTVISLGMDTAYTRFFYESGYSPLRLLFKCMQLPLVMVLLFVLILIEPNRWLLTYVFGGDIDSLFAFLLVGYVLFALLSKFSQLTARMGEFALNYVASNFVAKSGFVFGVVLVALILPKEDISITWVVISFLIAALCAMLINVPTLFRAKKLIAKDMEPVAAREMLTYGMPIMLNNVAMLVVPLIEKLIVRDLAGWEVLGIYTAASVFHTVIALMKTTLDNIWHPIVFKYYKNTDFFKQLLHDFGLLITGITALGLGACIFLRRWLVLVLDSAYYEVYLIAPAIMFAACYEIYTMIYAIGLNTEKKTLHVLVSPVLQVVVSVGLCYLLIPQLGLLGVGIAALMSVVISKTYRIVVGLSLYGTGTKEWKIAVLWTVCIAASIFVMFSVSLVSDLVVFLALSLASVLVINREGMEMIRRTGKLLLPQKMKKSEE